MATLALQTLATMAAFTVPAAAPAIARDLDVEPALVGFFVSMVYGVGILSAVLSPVLIRRFGAVRVGQAVLVAVVVMLVAAAGGGSVGMLALAAVLLGCGYGATAPVAAHLLLPRTAKRTLNLVISIRQIGVPLGGILSGLIVPPIVLAAGWRWALIVQVVPVVALLALLQIPRRRWDSDRDPRQPLATGAWLLPFRLLGERIELRALSVACFVYSGLQLCFIAFMTVHLTAATGFDLIRAGQTLAVYQISGAVSRPIWGWIADRLVPARLLLALQGLVMAAAAIATGQFGAGWPAWSIFLVGAVAGASASGFTGIAYAEYARIGGDRRTEATGLGSAVMFAGVLVIPSLFGVTIAAADSYRTAYLMIALLAAACGIALGLARQIPAGRRE
ncbi:MAG: MFS transporter [Alphaproteobacteria bacterium]|nr:MFS transporter [Alphaproteobacteria bacterium]